MVDTKNGFCADSESVNRRVHSNHTVIDPISEVFFVKLNMYGLRRPIYEGEN